MLAISSLLTAKQYAAVEQHLPPQIDSLALIAYEGGSVHIGVKQPLQLRHLARLTSLTVLDVLPGSQLPLRLQELGCFRCPSMQPVLPCKQLQRFTAGFNSAPAAELMKLSASLPGLTQLEFHYTRWSRHGKARAHSKCSSSSLGQPEWLLEGLANQRSLRGRVQCL